MSEIVSGIHIVTRAVASALYSEQIGTSGVQ